MFEPIDQLFDERVDAGAPGVDPEVRELVGRAPEVEQALELRSVDGQRAPAVRRQTRDDAIEGDIEPHRDAIALHDGAILRIDERSATGRHYGVSSVQDMAFDSECSCLKYTSRTNRT